MSTTTVQFRPGAFFVPNKVGGDAGRYHPCKLDDDGMPVPGTVQTETIVDDGEVIWPSQSYDKGWKAAKAALFIFLDTVEDEEAAAKRDAFEAEEAARKALEKAQARREHTAALRAFMSDNGIRSLPKGEAAFKVQLDAEAELVKRREAAAKAKAAK